MLKVYKDDLPSVYKALNLLGIGEDTEVLEADGMVSLKGREKWVEEILVHEFDSIGVFYEEA